MFTTYLTIAGSTLGAILLGAGVLHLLPRLGPIGRRVSQAFCRAPLLDLPITYFTVLPMFVGAIAAGWIGFAGAVTGQVAGVLAWTWIHELANRKHVRGPRIVKEINRIIGPFRNHAALWAMVPATPGFWMIRMTQLTVYPVLVAFAGLPAYRQGEWVNLSRQKFVGLVGHDLIWCLYCDWMTGLWSLGSEMLRNIESFWCPIRFHSENKCANCAMNFPDIDNGWVAANGTMAQVAATIEDKYGNGQYPRAWFGHPVRVTVKGKSVEEPEAVTA